MLRIFVVILLFLLIYNVIKLVLYIFRNVRNNLDEQNKKRSFENRQSQTDIYEENNNESGKVIELDKDQYKVE